ncbi:PIN domain-containing protein [Paenibacillus enshidis]|uniref:PIN domain-containing protein n=1 Tax=Paenibacillus enshidis TaxID=1458439 RepID=A0ABV5AS33_9BACL
MNIVDANLILRYLLQDAVQFIEQARDKIENHRIFIPNEVIAEVVYVLEKVYKVERVNIFDTLQNLLTYSNITTHD